MTRPLWKELLDHPTQAFDPQSAGLTLIAGGGDAAQRYAVRRWLGIRAGDSADVQAAIAVILAESFGDRRALDVLAEASPEPYPDQLSRFDGSLGPASLVAEVFGPRILDGLRAYLEDEGDLPFDLLAAAGRFQLDDNGEIYLPIRGVAINRTSGTPSAGLGMSFADRALEVAALATPDRRRVQHTVLASWGMDLPEGEAPMEDSRPGFAPTRWIATSHLVAAVSSWRIADRLISLAMEDEYWRTPTTDARAFVEALAVSHGDAAMNALQTIILSDVSASQAALAAMEQRTDRIEANAADARTEIRATAASLVDAGLVRKLPDLDFLESLVSHVAVQRDRRGDLAQLLLIADGSAAPLCLVGEFEPPYIDAVRVATELSGQPIGFDNAFLEPAEDPDHWFLRFNRAGNAVTRKFEATCNMLPVELLESFLVEATDQLERSDGRRLILLDHDGLDAVVGYVDPPAWAAFSEIAQGR
ncbi:hypothetical protein [Gulosibacter molinativorax]|uniref:Uncharacterized protein n=1 Tax=Gulosibacter molinativorax TaxID=256821 RepID=A0ABT7C3N8_9MICO|nr:hypothetical protein [Gulosibacter molinativorax]MDJ1369793.1 hypothetical protein [Gulosibacter molinativorax]QUY61758.1 Hypotetical protein [Gulosibacter molinativorax]